MTLKDRCISIYKEIEALGQLELKLKNEITEAENKIKVMHQNIDAIIRRKEKCKEYAEQNLDEQEAFSIENQIKVKHEMEAVNDFLMCPDQTLKCVADKYKISVMHLSRNVTKYLNV